MGVEQTPKTHLFSQNKSRAARDQFCVFVAWFYLFSTLAVHTSIDENIAFFGGVHFGVFLKAKGIYNLIVLFLSVTSGKGIFEVMQGQPEELLLQCCIDFSG